MLLGHEKAKQVKGYFNRFEYNTYIQDGDEVKIYQNRVYCRNEAHAIDIVEHWNSKCTGTCSKYSYELILPTPRTSYFATEIIENEMANKYRLLHYMELGIRDYIH